MKVARALPRRRECEPSQDFQVAASPSQNGGGDPLWRNWPIKRRESVLVAGGWTGLRQAQIGVTFIRRSFTGALQRLDFFWPWLKVEDERNLPKQTQAASTGILLCLSPLDGLVVPRSHHVVSQLLPDSSSRPVTHSRVCLALVVGPGEAIVCRSLGPETTKWKMDNLIRPPSKVHIYAHDMPSVNPAQGN